MCNKTHGKNLKAFIIKKAVKVSKTFFLAEYP